MIKGWVRNQSGAEEKDKETILDEIQLLNKAQEENALSTEYKNRRLALKEEYFKKVREEEIKQKQRSHRQWLKHSDRNTKYFHGMAFSRSRSNRI